MKYNRIKHKYFNKIEEYYKFCKKENIKIINVTTTHNYKIKVDYVIIKLERSC